MFFLCSNPYNIAYLIKLYNFRIWIYYKIDKMTDKGDKDNQEK